MQLTIANGTNQLMENFSYLHKGKIMTDVTKNLLILIQLNFIQAAMEGFVVGGEETEISKYPHSAFLNGRSKEAGYWICGSAILNQRLLLTAAHCVVGYNWEEDGDTKLIAFVGNEDLREVSTKRKIVAVTMHRQFNDQTMENDIALAFVRRNFILGQKVKRVVVTREYSNRDTQGYVAGWGLVRDDIEVSSVVLKHVRQRLRSTETCALIGQLHAGMFCAGSTEKYSEHPAKGDSGSAFVTQGYHQIGFVSFCIKRYPSLIVYTNVSYYYDWIRSNAKNLYCENV